MGGGDLNLKKSWHPHTMKNQERVWKAEQAKQEEQRKLDDLRKEINEERDREELRRIGENSGVLSSSGGGEAKLEWMYKNSAELINREEYLLGRKIDKSFEQLQAEERRQESTLGVKQSINHVEHECVPFSIREYRNLQSTEQVDMQRKTMEDPLMLIKQREMESRRKLLENPVRLKEIHRILKTEQEQATKRNKKPKKSKKTKKKKGRSHDDSDSNDDLDRKLAKQMKKLKGESTNDEFKLDKLLDAKYRTLTKQLDMATKHKKTKHKKKSRRRSRSSSSSSDDSDSSAEEPSKQTREKRGRRGRSNSKEAEPSKQTREKGGRRGRSNSKEAEQNKQSREIRGRCGRSNSSDNERTKRRVREDVKRHRDASNSRRWGSRSRSPRRDRDQRPQRREPSRERRRRSATPEKRPAVRRASPPAARQAAKSKPKLSESEREARLREMMDNATWREADRTKAVHKHREEYAREEAQNQARDFDQQFINKQVKKAIDNQTSIGNRIRSNLNNIQRTSAAMDTNFARK
ncbi:pre-mRNA-splicing factor CWC25 homolog [Drosophila novamexicana]|uniref:pre-mRNA-splicing factor CWC25 homolog n=1 Tax=Drosophila novamexicana TaxID=47314 RepID=UPI0011E5B4C9|nr:pre-mRNA-splicing factor CWC25 homolog [Drosophila novamexicana]